LMLIALMPWNPWVCVGYCAIMGVVGVLTATFFGLHRGVEVDGVMAVRAAR